MNNIPRNRNACTKQVTFNSIMKSKFFALGVKDAHAGKWRDLWGDDSAFQWHYERGRQFYNATKIRNITKTGSHVDDDLVAMFIECCERKEIL